MGSFLLVGGDSNFFQPLDRSNSRDPYEHEIIPPKNWVGISMAISYTPHGPSMGLVI